jgi:NitT/TauT family transport system permease protein
MTTVAKRSFKINGTVITVAWVAVLLAAWSLGTSFSLPGLGELPEAWLKLVRDESLVYDLGVSLKLNIEALLLSTVLSVGLAYLTVTETFRPLVHMFSKWRFFGMAGFVIIFTRIFGGGHALKVALLVFGISVFFLTSMIDVVSGVSRAEFDQTRSLRMSRARAVWEVVILGRADQAFDALRQNAAMGWMMLTMVEGLVRFEGGVGVVMLNEAKYRNLAAVFAVQLTVLAVGILQDQLLGWLKNVCCPYSKLTLEKR